MAHASATRFFQDDQSLSLDMHFISGLPSARNGENISRVTSSPCFAEAESRFQISSDGVAD